MEPSEADVDLFMSIGPLTVSLYKPKPWEWEVLTVWPTLPPGTQELFRRLYDELDYDLHIFGPGLALVYNPKRPTRLQLLKRWFNDHLR